MYHTRPVPTLPEFLALCAPQRAMHTGQQPQIADDRRTMPAEAREHLASIGNMARELMRPRPKVGKGIEWAYRLIERAERGEHVTVMQLAFAKEAIEKWSACNGTAKAWGIETSRREPGCDDEDVTNASEG